MSGGGGRRRSGLLVAAWAVLVLLLIPTAGYSGQATLTWNPNTEPDLAGYKIYVGESSRVYSSTLDVGTLTSYTVSGLVDGRVYYFAVTAYDVSGNESGFSAEVSTAVSDTTPPVISAVAVPVKTSSTASISWTTNEASDSQVEYGLTTAYGSSTTVNASLVTSHLMALSGLAEGRLYHFRVRSRDAAGNLATSADFTFTTLDGTPPSVSITAPAAGATVSGTVTVAASASDNVSVAGVQFKLNGANLGAEDTTAPYAVTWNTSAAPPGTHTLMAVARDAAGNVATAAAVPVTVVDTTAPVLSGITVASITSSGATISWTTSEASDTQVEYGLTTAYGSSTALDATLLTSHLVTLSGLAEASLYHFRVRSRDAAGNLATSADFTFATLDGTSPTIAITAPAAGATVAGTVTVEASATDNVGVAGVQFRLNGTPLGTETTVAPYSRAWNTTAISDGPQTLTAVARDAAGNTTTSAPVSLTVMNGIIRLSPQDTTINLNTTNYSSDTKLMTYTWPANQVANAIVMKFDLAGLPAGAVVQEATVHLALVESDGAPEPTYTVTAHKIVGQTPVIAAATGYTVDGVTGWTANTCCYSGVPLAQADISAAYDTQAIDKTLGYKMWTVTAMVQEWQADPASNGLLLNSDATKPADRYRYFASTEHSNSALRPFLLIRYSLPSTPDGIPPAVAITAPAAGATVAGAVTVGASATDNIGVVGVQFQLDGSPLGAEATVAPYAVTWNTATIANGPHTLTAAARDAAGNVSVSAGITVTVTNDTTRPVVSGVTATAITASGATITWTTDEASDSQVEYGRTTAYGSVTAVNGSLLTSHAVALSGLAEASLYHYRVHSRDAAGNLATSADFTFTTRDGTAPTVAITTPIAGATVTGTITVGASASDNIGVASVQFKVDGVNLGAKDTTGPYLVSWDTKTISNGTHTLTAVARDAAGNVRTSAAVTVTVANDLTAPVVSIIAPNPGATLAGAVTIEASATDNVGVAGVQVRLDGALLGAEITAAPYGLVWNTTTVSDGPHTLTAVARDAAGNATTSASVSVTVTNGIFVVEPEDTSINLDTTNYSADAKLMTYTWPARQVANAILMKFDLSGIPAGTVVEEAILYLALVESDATADATYMVTAHKVVGKSPVLTKATGQTFDGVVGWTPNVCCHNGVPLAQADISAAYDTRAVDKAPGDKTWTITTMVREWLADPAGNFGLLLNSDASTAADRYRYFASMEHPDLALRPFLYIRYALAPTPDGTPPSVAITTPAAGATVAGAETVGASATDNVGVVGVQFQLDGSPLGAEATVAPYAVAWNTGAVANGIYTLTAVARDAAGNLSVSAGVTVTVANDTISPVLSGVTAASITSSGATISWTSDEASDTQVEYGTTTAYGSTTAPNGSLVTSHMVTLGGLAENTVYHFRVRSRDGAGNLATSADFTFTTLDGTPPAVAITAPAAGATVAGPVTVGASVTDNVGVVAVQFQLDGASLGAEATAAPWAVAWDTATVPNGPHMLTAVARDATGNVSVSAGISVTVANSFQVSLSPQDTFINLNATNYSTNTLLATYTWPDNRVANAILMKFDLSSIPAGAVVQEATIHLALVQSDGAPEGTYTVTAHKMVGKNPVFTGATGYTADGTSWTPNACCHNGVPLAQADISAAYDTQAVDKTPGYKMWTVTAMVLEWLADPANNFGLLLNSDATKPADRYRYFASMEHPNAQLRPYLKVTYSLPPQ